MNKPLFLPLGALLLFSCGEPASSMSRIDYSSGESKEPESSSQAPTEKDFVSRYLRKLSSYRSYKAVTKGSTKAKVWFVETTQSIDVMLIKGEYRYLKNESHSSFVNTVHTAYFHDGNAAYRNDEGKYKVESIKAYLDAYGVYPFDPAIEGYLCEDGCIQSVERIPSSQGYAFKIAFDPEKATTNVRIQMKAFGGLDDYPVFSKINVTIYVKKDLTPEHLDVAANYDAKRGVDTSCKQEYRVDFSNFNEDIEIPDLETIKTEYGL